MNSHCIYTFLKPCCVIYTHYHVLNATVLATVNATVKWERA